MCFETKDRTRRTFVSIINGKFAIRVDSDTPNAQKRYSEKLKKDLWEIVHETFTGKIKRMEVRGSEYGDQLTILMDDVGDLYEFQIPTESRYFQSFCERMENVDFTKEVKLSPYSFDDKEKKNSKGNPKKVSGINFFQNGNKIEKYYTKENPKDKPTLKENYSDADLKIFFIQQEEFFKKKVAEVNARIPDNELVKSEMATSTFVADTEKDEEIQELPF